MRVLMVASENDALPGFKVGGIGDVLRDVPKALVLQGVDVDVVVPDYFDLHRTGNAEWIMSLFVGFCGRPEQVELFKLPSEKTGEATQWLLSHPLFSQHGSVYCDDDHDRPFATDANKYALFSVAVCEWLTKMPQKPDVLHLHDWHAATIASLIEFDQKYQLLMNLRTVYTVHNIALQGIRPFKGDASSFEHWFPNIGYNGQVLCDPRYPDCYNPVAAAINLCDKLHLVSPTYAEEVLRPSNIAEGYFGGEGLEALLNQHRGKIVGILNGCEYAERHSASVNHTNFLQETDYHIIQWMAKSPVVKTSQYLAHRRALAWLEELPTGPMMTSIGRLTDQKALLLKQRDSNGTALDRILRLLEKSKASLVMMGSGDANLEFEITQHMARHDNFLFINGYNPKLSDDLYDLGDMFLMPSSFEPCGISQMMALRAGQPCIVHGVGGLKDTIVDGYNGFIFNGENLAHQADEMVLCVERALQTFNTPTWDNMVRHALDSRFLWSDSMKRYMDELYH